MMKMGEKRRFLVKKKICSSDLEEFVRNHKSHFRVDGDEKTFLK